MDYIKIKNPEEYQHFKDIMSSNEIYVENGYDFDINDRCLIIAIENSKCVEYCWNSNCDHDCALIKNCIIKNNELSSVDQYFKELRIRKLERICK